MRRSSRLRRRNKTKLGLSNSFNDGGGPGGGGSGRFQMKKYTKMLLILVMSYRFYLYLQKNNKTPVEAAIITDAHASPSVISADNHVSPQRSLTDPIKSSLRSFKAKPKPLRPLNLEIISRTHPIDLTYVDVTNGFKNDPHLGALDEDDNLGYVHDETSLRKNPPKLELENMATTCQNKDGNYKMLTKKVLVDFKSHEEAELNSNKKRAKIFCTVYTIEKNHDRIPPILETWGQRCDGFMVASDKTDLELQTVNIPHEGEEEYQNIWQKVRSIWSYVYDNYYNDYDWFHIGGDDLYILVENLRLYLESEEIQLAANGGKDLPKGDETEQYPLFLGRRFKEQGNVNRIFNSGGSGYTLNKAALKALIVDAFPTCAPNLKTFAEDVMVAQCFRNKLNVYPYDTKDEEGAERYMPFQPAHHLTYRIPKGESNDWYVKYSIDIKEGLDHCSARSVAFHYIKSPLMKRMHAILYGHCE